MGFRDERYFHIRSYALHKCPITPKVGYTKKNTINIWFYRKVIV